MAAAGSAGATAQPGVGRGERTRLAILAASRQLFLERGYAGTPINAITEACGISRAGFYTYFKDKREIFTVLGETAYHDVLDVIGQWPDTTAPGGRARVAAFVSHYFDYMDTHGAFVLASAHSAPSDEAFRSSRNRMVSRASWKLGQALSGQALSGQALSGQAWSGDSAHSPDVIGAAVMGLLDRAWYTVHGQTVGVERDEMVAVVTEMILAFILAGRGAQSG
jgi:TetR/AcrR family transcriptional regulator